MVWCIEQRHVTYKEQGYPDMTPCCTKAEYGITRERDNSREGLQCSMADENWAQCTERYSSTCMNVSRMMLESVIWLLSI